MGPCPCSRFSCRCALVDGTLGHLCRWYLLSTMFTFESSSSLQKLVIFPLDGPSCNVASGLCGELQGWWKVKGSEVCHVELAEVVQEGALDQVFLGGDLEVEMGGCSVAGESEVAYVVSPCSLCMTVGVDGCCKVCTHHRLVRF